MAQAHDSTDDELHDKLIGAFDCAGFAFDPTTIDIDTTPDIKGRVGAVTIDQDGASLTLNDPDSDTLDAALGFHGWEAATLRLTDDGTGVIISIWEIER